MKTTKKPLFMLISLFVLISSLLFTSIAYAGTSSTSGGVGDANCTASKTITQGASSWAAYVKMAQSVTHGGQSVNIVLQVECTPPDFNPALGP
ncbi:MAG: hypothetical protein NTW69_08810 [Chloroflexi bacterium]|nr:hypothetical protein [Chloroflexota bacterium]